MIHDSDSDTVKHERAHAQTHTHLQCHTHTHTHTHTHKLAHTYLSVLPQTTRAGHFRQHLTLDANRRGRWQLVHTLKDKSATFDAGKRRGARSMHACIHMHIYIYIIMYIHIYMYICICTHVYTHVYVYTCIHV